MVIRVIDVPAWSARPEPERPAGIDSSQSLLLIFKWGDGLITFKLFEESKESHFHAGATIPFVADLWEDGINVEEIWAHDASCGAPHANRASHFRTSCDEIPARFQRDELGPILAGYRLDENNPIGGCGGDAVS
jgi:hypothetical protein